MSNDQLNDKTRFRCHCNAFGNALPYATVRHDADNIRVDAFNRLVLRLYSMDVGFVRRFVDCRAQFAPSGRHCKDARACMSAKNVNGKAQEQLQWRKLFLMWLPRLVRMQPHENTVFERLLNEEEHG